MIHKILTALLLLIVSAAGVWAESDSPTPTQPSTSSSRPALQTIEDWNRRMNELVRAASPGAVSAASPMDYRIGKDDLLTITVFEAPDLNRSLRVTSSGEISLPLLGVVKAAGLTARELELVLQELLRRTYMKDPHVGVMISEMPSHNVSVLGAVIKPGVFPIPSPKSLLEILSMAQGLAPDAGDTVLVVRGTLPDINPGQSSDRGPKVIPPPQAAGGTSGATEASTAPGSPPGGETIEVNLKSLLESGDPRYNVQIYPGDTVKVKLAGIIYVVGEVKTPGGFTLKNNENMTVLQALALGQGLTPMAAKRSAKIIRTTSDGGRSEVPVDLDKVLKGKAPNLTMQSKDVLFVPNNAVKSAARYGVDAVSSFMGGLTRWAVWRRF